MAASVTHVTTQDTQGPIVTVFRLFGSRKAALAAAGYGIDKPPLDAIAPKIQEVLLQQEVSGLLQDWLKSLRDEGSVQIVDPAYAALADAGSGDESE